MVRHRDAGGHVVRLRDVRLHQRRVRPQAHLRHLHRHRRGPDPRYISIAAPLALLLLGPFVAFFATGYFSGFGAVTAEIYPTEIRASAQGFTYNMGRITSALAPFVVGSLAQQHGFQAALSLTSIAFLLAAVTWIWIPETRGARPDVKRCQRTAAVQWPCSWN